MHRQDLTILNHRGYEVESLVLNNSAYLLQDVVMNNENNLSASAL